MHSFVLDVPANKEASGGNVRRLVVARGNCNDPDVVWKVDPMGHQQYTGEQNADIELRSVVTEQKEGGTLSID